MRFMVIDSEGHRSPVIADQESAERWAAERIKTVDEAYVYAQHPKQRTMGQLVGRFKRVEEDHAGS